MIRKQDATTVIVYIASNPDGQTLAWDFVRKNWAYMFTEWAQHKWSFTRQLQSFYFLVNWNKS